MAKNNKKNKKSAPKTTKKEIDWTKVLKALTAPHVTEKATSQEEQSKYIFKVPTKTNKIMIKQAIKQLYGKKPLKIAIINVRRKKRRKAGKIGYRAGYKKAIVSFKKGEKLDLFAKK